MAFNPQFDNPNAIDGADYLFRSKKKKAEVKIKKAEKAAAKGNVKKAQRKLDKGIKALEKLNPDAAKTKAISAEAQKAADKIADVTSKQQAQTAALTQSTTTQPEPGSPLMQPLDPVATQSGTTTPGWTPGTTGGDNSGWGLPLSGGGGGGGDTGGGGDLGSDPGQAIQDQWNQAALEDSGAVSPDTTTVDQAAADQSASGGKTLLIVGIVIIVAVALFFYLKKSK